MHKFTLVALIVVEAPLTMVPLMADDAVTPGTLGDAIIPVQVEVAGGSAVFKFICALPFAGSVQTGLGKPTIAFVFIGTGRYAARIWKLLGTLQTEKRKIFQNFIKYIHFVLWYLVSKSSRANLLG